ncbi:MAG: 3,4-dehydroadipyl-CoA semialdehyde dehydrogenase [Kofleriaceae bacterium]|jgi:3,4-dehydroadipyl-CoA semialdehyde dehydrogenase|nr:3,4-dehydroadipyl-CoA semialdehyde dehydrogenase [Kofleriaceae bacterium]MBP9208033.1 3,4-dehydroadipyl-CoA semialdehyde dehydrogenase [Kofleriaceae bacterium]
MKTLGSYLAGQWFHGAGRAIPLLNPATEQVVAQVLVDGHDLAAGFAHARAMGRPALAALTFAERAALLGAMAKAIHGAREELIELAIANGGNTRGDAKFDIDGASATLAYYAELGATLPGRGVLADGDPVQLGRTARLSGQHVYVACPGVAVHINAFNFPAWGLAEKAACALLAGMPVISKPATATALVAHRLAELFAPLLPAGVFHLFVGPPAGLLDHCRPGDVVAFTGSSTTAAALRTHPRVVQHALRLSIEADSLNAAVLGPDVEVGSETFGLFVADVARDATQKSGQKCTAIRRVLVPASRVDDVAAALRERLAGIVIGDPSRDDVRMGPLATAQQRADVTAGINRLAAATSPVFGGTGEVDPVGVAAGTGFFVGPVVRLAASAVDCGPMYEHEIFGPVTTLAPYSDDPTFAAHFVARGEGGLCCSVYSDDRDVLARFLPQAAAWVGRIYMGSAKMAAMSPGPGTVLPALVHGGPGRAGGGEELGGLRGVHHYMQRCALQGDLGLIKGLTG